MAPNAAIPSATDAPVPVGLTLGTGVIEAVIRVGDAVTLIVGVGVCDVVGVGVAVVPLVGVGVVVLRGRGVLVGVTLFVGVGEEVPFIGETDGCVN